MKHTFETVSETLTTLANQAAVYKSDVGDLKHAMRRAFEADFTSLKQTYLHNDKFKTLTTEESLVAEALPYGLHNWFGQKFSFILIKAPLTEFPEAVRSLRNRWRPLFLKAKELERHQTKGRKPRLTDAEQQMRDQYRGLCSFCFRDSAVNVQGLIHAHGYNIARGFHNGTCMGAARPHFHTAAGRDVARGFEKTLRRWADDTEAKAVKLQDARADILAGTNTSHTWRDRLGQPTTPTGSMVDTRTRSFYTQARELRSHADVIANNLMTWGEAPPRHTQVPSNN